MIRLLALPVGWLVLGALLGADDKHAEWKARLADDGRRVALEDSSNNDCLRCHQAIGQEWLHSTHATAWQDEHYQKALAKIRRKQGCWGCHAPEPLAAAAWPQKPAARESDRHLGVTCVTCHLAADGETMLGPAGHANAAHPSEAHEVFDSDASNALCIACHATNIGPVIGVAKDFVSTDQAELGSSCVECHMGRTKRAWAEPWEDGQQAFPMRRGRSHRIKTPRDPDFLSDAFHLSAERTPKGARLTIENQTGHRVPGVQGRSIHFEAYLAEAAEDPASAGKSGAVERKFDYRSFLPVEDAVSLELEGSGDILHVRGMHTPPGTTKAQLFLKRTIELESR